MRDHPVIIGTSDWQALLTFIRGLIFLACLVVVGLFGGINLDRIDPAAIADQIREKHPLLQYLRPFLIIWGSVTHSWRYMIMPLGAMLFVLGAGSLFIKDVYALKRTKDAMRYVMASMFGTGYPALVVDKGEKQISKRSINLIDKIGGPGVVIIEPGNGAVFRFLRKPSRASVTSTYFLAPFETISQTINLDEQQCDKDEVTTMTRDGLKVAIRDIHFRYRIQQMVRNNVPVRRSLREPYPFSDEAMQNIAFSLAVTRDGLEKWTASVERVVIGAITDFVAAHTVDYLTAPRDGPDDPRFNLRNELFLSGIKRGLATMGAELLWADVGHIDIVDDSVDDSRTSLWAAEWVADSDTKRAMADARRMAYQELGRAEAQAELIMSITDVLNKSIGDDCSVNTIRKLILARTAQILDAMSSPPAEDN